MRMEGKELDNTTNYKISYRYIGYENIIKIFAPSI